MAVKQKFYFSFLILSIVLLVIVWYLAGFRFIHMNLAVVFGTIFFILWTYKTKISTKEVTEIHLAYFNSQVFSLIFAILFLASVYILYTSTTIIKPISYFILTSFMAIIIVMGALFAKTKSGVATNLLQSFVLALNLRCGTQIIFPEGAACRDGFYHILTVSSHIVQNGYIPEGHTYTFYPMLHLINSAVSIICSTDIWLTSCWMAGFIASLGVFFIFLFGRKFIGIKVGLFAALLYAISGHLIGRGSFMQPMTLSTVIILLILYLLLSNKQSPNISWAALGCLTLPVIILTHHFSSVMFIIFLVSFLMIQVLMKLKTRKVISELKNYRFTIIVVLYGTMLLAYWMYVSMTFGWAIDIINFFRETAIQTFAVEEAINPLARLDIKILNELGFCILIFFTTFGFLYTIEQPTTFRLFIMFSIIGLTTYIAFNYLFSGFLYANPFRAFSFLELGMVFFAAEALTLVFEKKGIYALVVIIFILSFFMSASTTANTIASPLKFDSVQLAPGRPAKFCINTVDWMENGLNEKSKIYREDIFPINSSNGIFSKLNEGGRLAYVEDIKEIPINSYAAFYTEGSYAKTIILQEEYQLFKEYYNGIYDSGLVEIYQKCK